MPSFEKPDLLITKAPFAASKHDCPIRGHSPYPNAGNPRHCSRTQPCPNGYSCEYNRKQNEFICCGLAGECVNAVRTSLAKCAECPFVLVSAWCAIT